MMKNMLLGALILGVAVLYGSFHSEKHSTVLSDMSPAFRGIDGTYFRARSGLWLHTHSFPVESHKGTVFFIHGYTQHALMYRKLFMDLNAAGYAVEALDLPGHGKSEGDRAYFTRFSELTNAVLEFAASKPASGPRFLFGHSLGGLTSITVTLGQPTLFTGLVLSNAALAIEPEIAVPWKIAVGRQLSKYLPRFPIASLDPSRDSKDPAVVAAILADPLYCKGCMVSSRVAAEVLAQIELVHGQAAKASTPMLVLVGEVDLVCPPEGSISFVKAATRAKDATLKSYPGVHHDLFHEPEAAAILADVVEWMNARATAAQL